MMIDELCALYDLCYIGNWHALYRFHDQFWLESTAGLGVLHNAQ
jgi:hypothetical protein